MKSTKNLTQQQQQQQQKEKKENILQKMRTNICSRIHLELKSSVLCSYTHTLNGKIIQKKVE